MRQFEEGEAVFFIFVLSYVLLLLLLLEFAHIDVSVQYSLFQLLMGPWVFMVFIVIQIFFIIYVAIVVPETKGRNIEEITAQFRK